MTIAQLVRAYRRDGRFPEGAVLPKAHFHVRSAEGYVGRFPGLDVPLDPTASGDGASPADGAVPGPRRHP